MKSQAGIDLRRALPGTVLVCVLMLTPGCRRGNERAETKPTSTAEGTIIFSAAQVQHGGVRWEPAQKSEGAATTETPAQLVPDEDHTARLGSPAQGRILAVHVKLGERVMTGQIVVTLQGQQASLARADLDKARAALGSRRVELTYARTARERAERLLAAKALAPQDLERARAEEEAASAALAQAEAELARSSAETKRLGVDTGSGEMKVRSPISGFVLSRDATPGAVVEAGALLVTISDASTLWLEIAMPDRLVANVRPNQTVRFAVPAFGAETFEAKVQSVGRSLDAATRTIPVRALVQNSEERLQAQMFATAWIETGSSGASVSVPDAAVVLLEEKPVVFIAKPDAQGGARFERKEVEVGSRRDGRALILHGLSPGDLIVVDGAFAVKSQFERFKMVEG